MVASFFGIFLLWEGLVILKRTGVLCFGGAPSHFYFFLVDFSFLFPFVSSTSGHFSSLTSGCTLASAGSSLVSSFFRATYWVPPGQIFPPCKALNNTVCPFQCHTCTSGMLEKHQLGVQGHMPDLLVGLLLSFAGPG